MERVPNIDISRKNSPQRKLISIFIYIVALAILLLAADYLFVKKNILRTINPVSQMQEYYKDKKYTKVVEKGAGLLDKYPNSLIIRRYMWKSYLYTNQFSMALKTIRSMETLSPNPLEIYLAYCTTFRFMGEYEKVYYYCGKALDIKPTNQIAHEQIVQAMVEQKKYDEAIKYLDKIAKQQPDDLKALILRANIATLQGDYKKSIQILEKARKANPESAIIYYYLGEDNFILKDYLDAAGYYEEFVDSVYKKDVDVELLENAYTNLALSYERSGMYSNAYRAYKSAACLTTKLGKNNETISLLTKAAASTYAGYNGFVSQADFQKKFKKLEKEMEHKCGAQLFSGEQEEEEED
jgi:tetratricopeptide (TPR) repeat protein